MRLSFHYLLFCSFALPMLPHASGVLRNVVRISRVEVIDTPIMRVNATVAQHGSGSAVDVDMIVAQDLPQLKINAVLTIRTKNGKGQAALYNNTINMCDFLLQKSWNRLLQEIGKEFMCRGNVPSRCPFRSGTYSVRNATFAKARVPSFIPASYFLVDMNLLNGNPLKLIVATRWYGRFIKV